MDLNVWLLYVGTILVFMSTPGPSHILMLSVSMSNGFKRSLATAAGDLSANAIQILLAGFGLAAVIMASQYGFTIIKWLGVAYLVWVGIKTIAASFKSKSLANQHASASLSKLWLRGFITSAANPKAVVFFAALFPQFIDPTKPLALQIAVLGATYIVIDGMFLSAYGFGASWIAKKLKNQYTRLIDRLSGISLITASVLLGLRTND